MLGSIPALVAHQQVPAAVVPWVTVAVMHVTAVEWLHPAFPLQEPARFLPRCVLGAMLRVVSALVLRPWLSRATILIALRH